MLFSLLQAENRILINCIPLHETLQLSWRVDNDNSNIRFGLCGCQSHRFKSELLLRNELV